MGRRKEKDPPISLFFFQDIITCVSGFMILVMLIFAISAPTEAVPEAAPETEPEPVVDLSPQIDALREQMFELRNRISAQAYAQDTKALRGKIESAENENSALERQLQELAGEESHLKAQKRQLEDALRSSKAELDIENNVRRISLVSDSTRTKSSFVIICSKTSFECNVLKSRAQPTRFASSDAKSLITHLDRFDPDSYTILFLLKPSADVELFQALLYLLREKGYSVGYDALEENDQLYFNGSLQ